MDTNEIISQDQGRRDEPVKLEIVDREEKATILIDSTITKEVEKKKTTSLSKEDAVIIKEEREHFSQAKSNSSVIGKSFKESIQGIIQPNVVLMPKESLTKEEKDYAETIPTDSNGNPIVPDPMSRKNQHETTVLHLKDEMKRAEYMSNFHARPHEMDRKSGAVSHIQKSQESTFIFVDLDENEGDGNECAFGECGLHERVVKAITSSTKGRGLSLKRPTMVQQNAWSQMLKGNNVGKNLFIQSETGSGKTLAYFLPILQVRTFDAVLLIFNVAFLNLQKLLLQLISQHLAIDFKTHK